MYSQYIKHCPPKTLSPLQMKRKWNQIGVVDWRPVTENNRGIMLLRNQGIWLSYVWKKVGWRLAISVPEGTLGLWRGRKRLVVARAGLCGFGQGAAPWKGFSCQGLASALTSSFSNNCYLCHLRLEFNMKINIFLKSLCSGLIFPLPQPYVDSWAGRYSYCNPQPRLTNLPCELSEVKNCTQCLYLIL